MSDHRKSPSYIRSHCLTGAQRLAEAGRNGSLEAVVSELVAEYGVERDKAVLALLEITLAILPAVMGKRGVEIGAGR